MKNAAHYHMDRRYISGKQGPGSPVENHVPDGGSVCFNGGAGNFRGREEPAGGCQHDNRDSPEDEVKNNGESLPDPDQIRYEDMKYEIVPENKS